MMALILRLVVQVQYIQGHMSLLIILVANLDLMGSKHVFKFESNPWAPPIVEQLSLGLSHMFDYIKSDTYK